MNLSEFLLARIAEDEAVARAAAQLTTPAWRGAEPTWITCRTCDGEGTVRGAGNLDWTCETCNGDGGMEP